MRFRFYFVLVGLVFFGSGCGAPVVSESSVVPEPLVVVEPVEDSFGAQMNEGGEVTVEVTPLNLSVKGETWDFSVELGTHSVDLSQDLMEVAALVDSEGNEFSPLAWEGDPVGGHHREGVLTFSALPEDESQVDLRIRTVADVPERVFVWDLPFSYQDISSGELAAWLPNKDFKLVDVHIPEQAHIPGTDAVIPFNEMDDIVAFLPDKNEKIVLYCRSGGMSPQVAGTLADMGYSNVYNLKYGLNEWVTEGGSVE